MGTITSCLGQPETVRDDASRGRQHAGATARKSYIHAMDRIAFLSALIIGVLLIPVSVTAQRADKPTARTGKSETASNPTRTHTSSSKSSSKTSSSKNSAKTSKGTPPSAVTAPLVGDGGAAALEAMEVERVTRLEQDRLEADVKKDKRWFEDSLADDLTSATSDGRLENKAQVIARCLDPAATVESEKYEELSVRPYGDVIIAIGRLSQTAKGNNTQRRFTDVWVNRGGMWKQVATHISAVAAGNVASQSPAAAASQPQNPNTQATSGSPSPATTQPSQSTRPSPSASPRP